MIDGLVGLLVAVIIVGIVVGILYVIIDMIPMDPRFNKIAKLLLILIAVLIILARGLPLLGVAI
jgi:hypothetical protein